MSQCVCRPLWGFRHIDETRDCGKDGAETVPVRQVVFGTCRLNLRHCVGSRLCVCVCVCVCVEERVLLGKIGQCVWNRGMEGSDGVGLSESQECWCV